MVLSMASEPGQGMDLHISLGLSTLEFTLQGP